MNYRVSGGNQSEIIAEQCQDVFDVGYWECDPAAETVRCDEATHEMLGIDQERRVTLETWLSMIHPADRSRLAKRVTEVTTTDDCLDMRVRTASEDETEQLVHLRAEVTDDRLCGIVRDVTAQQAQTQQLERHEALFNNTQDAQFVIDVEQSGADTTQFVIEQVNQAYEQTVGVPAAEIEGKTPTEAFGEETGTEVTTQYRECVETQAVCQYEERFEHDGDTRIWETRLAPVVVDGDVTQLVGSTRDITAHKQQEQELHEVAEKLELAVEAANLGVWEWDLTTDSFEYNDQWAEIVGVDGEPADTEERVDIDLWESRIHPDDIEVLDQIQAGKLHQETDEWVGDHRLRTTNGGGDKEWKWVRAIGEIIERTPTGEPKRAAGVLHEIDNKKRAIETLRKEQTLFAQGPVVVFKWDNDPEAGWPVTYVSENVEDVFGYTPGELYAREPAYSEIIHDDDLAEVKKEVEEHSDSETEQFQHEPYRITTASGETRWVLDHTQNVRDEEGDIIERVGYVVDITGQKEREIQLEQAETVGEFGTWKWGVETDHNWWSERMYEIFEQPRDEGPLTYEEILQMTHPDDRAWVKESWESGSGETYDAEFRVQVNGTEKWIKAQCVRNFDADGEIAYSLGVFKNITDRKKHEQIRTSVIKTGRELLGLESSEKVLTKVATVAVDVFDAKASSVYLYDEENGLLSLEATAGTRHNSNDQQTVTPADEAVWNVYASQSRTVLSQKAATNHREEDINDKNETETQIDQCVDTENQGVECIIPLGTHGILLLNYETQKDTRQLLDLAEILGNITATALNQTERLSELQTENERLSSEIDTLEDRLELYESIQTVLQAVEAAESTADIRQQICQTLSTVVGFDGVWFGRPDYTDNYIEPVVKTTMPTEYFEKQEIELESDSQSPAARVVATQTEFRCRNIAKEKSRYEWHNTALVHGFQSVLSIPILHNNVLFGVLSIYSKQTNAFDEQTTAVLSKLGQFIGFALKTTGHQNAVTGEQTKQIDFDVDPTEHESHPIYKLCREVSISVVIENVSQRYDESHLIHTVIEDIDAETLDDAAAAIDGINSITPIGGRNESTYEIVTVGTSLPGKVIGTSAGLQSVKLSEQSCRISYIMPAKNDVQELISQVQGMFNTVSMKSKYKRDTQKETSVANINPNIVNKSLSERQQTILQAAYHSGYFDRDRKRTGGEIAASLDIAQPTFSKHLRKAQRNLFEAIWD